LGKFLEALQRKMLVDFMAIWSILCPFGVFYGYLIYFSHLRTFGTFFGQLVYCMVIWYIFPRFGILCREKSGNPGAHCGHLSSFRVF
jgi:hypothetical protein